jgi:hypothetical protein
MPTPSSVMPKIECQLIEAFKLSAVLEDGSRCEELE